VRFTDLDKPFLFTYSRYAFRAVRFLVYVAESLKKKGVKSDLEHPASLGG
jgi:hypothetical protein